MQALDDLLMEADGDITGVEEYVDRLFAENETSMKSKVDGYCALINELKYRAEVRKQEADRLVKRSRIDKSSADWLTARLKGELEHRGIDKMDTDRFKVGVAKVGGKQKLDIYAEVPDAFCDLIPERLEPNKDKIREALDRGETLNFAILMERGTRLSVR
tara:strand:- start:460 stop:939 length:480 start_codon:yes stop_codon:yes gene_type:complete